MQQPLQASISNQYIAAAFLAASMARSNHAQQTSMTKEQARSTQVNTATRRLLQRCATTHHAVRHPGQCTCIFPVLGILIVAKIAMSLPWVKEVQKLLADDALPINMKASKTMAELEKAGMVWSSKLKPNQVLVHPQNRSGQMCNPHDVLQKGLAISEVGWELAKVRSPVGVQIGSGAQRDAIFDANQRLHDQSGGIMAKPSGQETIASISASHTTAFLRCVENGCKLPDDTSIEQLLHQGDDLQTMISDGWLWTVVSAKVEEEVPAVLSVLQQAYNCHLICKGCFV